MADESDMADAYIAAAITSALEEIKKNALPQQGAEFCKECEEPMLTARRELGFQYCIACARDAERREALYK